jgi:hypothetical protein
MALFPSKLSRKSHYRSLLETAGIEKEVQHFYSPNMVDLIFI